jgi:hypothetical protein
MLEIGQLRRWTWKHSPLPVVWEDKVFLTVSEELRWIDPDGNRHSTWTILIDGDTSTRWRGADIERMSELIEHHN